MTTADRPLLEALRTVLGAGTIQDRGRRRAGWQPESRLTIASEQAHLRAVVPFAERFLAPGAKRRQFEAWRDELVAYRVRRPVRVGLGPSTCRVEGCTDPVRGQSVCRRHYYELTGW